MAVDLLRGERLEEFAHEAIEYTSSVSHDEPLVKPVIMINQAHMVMLIECGLIKYEYGIKCLEALESIPHDLKLDPKLEDVHMNIESFVIKKVGEEIGGQLNLGKSRNDQVATAIRMVLREYVLDITSNLIALCKTIIQRSMEHLETIIPGYTHLQHAQPVTLAHHLLAYCEALIRDGYRLRDAYNRVNISPMGSAALATTNLKIDRELTASLLGFEGLVVNSIDAVSTRDFAVEVISDLSLLMTDLSRMAEELILWSTYEFGIVEIPDEYASTSSIMPQKKNAVVAEMIRSKTSTIYGDLIASLSILNSLPYSYNLDLQ
ncbi:MAG: argininosuccinate lyase, partial [Nitrososphaerales archaeon]|nr:argininosuccinate lyase [Nitrososphaerales archaeon]